MTWTELIELVSDHYITEVITLGKIDKYRFGDIQKMNRSTII